ncbi:MAG: hypothetical protein L3J24_12380 [Xanthomonadales bacterium]|nr:hypothetical protein [Xanthomonadales bacterium]
MNNFLRVAICTLALIATTAATAQPQPEIVAEPAVAKAIALPDSVRTLQGLASKAYAQKKNRAFVKIMEKLHRLRPLDTDYMYQLALAYSLVNNKNAAYDLMLTLQRQGAAYDFNATEDSKNLRGTEVYEYINDLMVRALEPSGSVENVLTLADDVVLPEAIDWDPLNQTFLIGTVADGRILRVDDKGKSSTLFQADAENGMWSIYDIKVDVKRKIFWVSSAALPGYKNYSQADFGRSALFKFDLKSGKLLQRYPMALDGNPHSFANMALADDGSVYIADSQAPILYVFKPGDSSPKVFAASTDLLSIRSIVLNKDNTYLYLSDYSNGLFIINLEDSQMRAPVMPETLNTSGIDGMYRWADSLVIIQNGFTPSRVLRLQLDSDGVEIIDMAPLAVSQLVFDNPNFGVIRGDWLYYFANSHWGKVASNGKVAKPVSIVRTGVEEALNVVTPDLDLFIEQMKKRQQEEQAQ